MKVSKRKRINKRKILNKKYTQKATRKKKLTNVYHKWISARKTYSSVPYILNISFFRRNIFFNVSDFRGQTKFWTNAGRHGLSGRTKIAKLAVITMTENFVKEIWKQGIRCILIKFNKYSFLKRDMLKIMKSTQKKRKIRFLGIITKLSLSFNGCRRKKRRWK